MTPGPAYRNSARWHHEPAYLRRWVDQAHKVPRPVSLVRELAWLALGLLAIAFVIFVWGGPG